MFRWLNPIGRPQVEHEQLFPGRQTYARYLHVAESVAEDETQAAWDGLGGRLKALRREMMAGQVDVKAKVGQVEAKLDAVEAKLEAGMAGVKTKVGQVDAKLEAMEAKVDRVEAGMADVKELLEQLVAQR